MPGISIHVVDVSRGIVASGMQVDVLHDGRQIVSGKVGPKGLLEGAALAARFDPGYYEARFHVGDWYSQQLVSLPNVPFLDTVTYRFGITDSEQHYHLPFKCTPWGYSCFRGGA